MSKLALAAENSYLSVEPPSPLVQEGSPKWTDVLSAGASVASAVISALSLVAAAVAAISAYKAYKKQAGQLEITRKHDLRWQSSHVTGWIESEIDTSGIKSDPHGLNLLRRLSFKYINASPLPVYDVTVAARERESGKPVLLYGCDILYPTGGSVYVESIPAAEWANEVIQFSRELSEHLPSEFRQQDLDAVQTVTKAQNDVDQKSLKVIEHLSSTMVMEFRDSEGNIWCRLASGELSTDYAIIAEESGIRRVKRTAR